MPRKPPAPVPPSSSSARPQRRPRSRIKGHLGSGKGRRPGFVFREELAQRVVDFFEQCLTHIKGELAGQPLILDQWERDILREAFGWVSRETGLRQYRTLWLEVARKNGKSTLCAGLGLYLLHADGEQGAEVYSAAADKDQARIVFGLAKQMTERSGPLRERTMIYRDSLVHEGSASFYRVLSSDAHTKHGLNASGIVVDEVHAQPNGELVEVLRTSTGARQQPMAVFITTAGFDKHSICWQMHDYAQKVIEGVIEDPSFLPVIYAAPEGMDWRDEATWIAANPGIGHSISLDYLRTECLRAQQMPLYENVFKRLHLNIWTEQDTRWISLLVWDKNSASVEPVLGRKLPAFVGVDLSSTTDITAVVLAVQFPDRSRWALLPHFFVPAENIIKRAERDRVPYPLWRDRGLLTATEGNVVDYEVVRRRINELGDDFDIKEIAVDRWNATGIMTQLTNDGFTVVPFGQGFASMSGPSKEFERLLLAKQIAHGGHPILRWMASCVAVQQDAAGNIKPDKAKSSERIDGIVAAVMALGRALIFDSEAGVVSADALLFLGGDEPEPSAVDTPNVAA
jgi:phage terminase large subunit-like protein